MAECPVLPVLTSISDCFQGVLVMNLTFLTSCHSVIEYFCVYRGFKDSSTAHLMMQRAKKMKYNAERKKKIGKLGKFFTYLYDYIT